MTEGRPKDDLDRAPGDSLRRVPPSVVIKIPLEGSPTVTFDALTDGERARLDAWLEARPELENLVIQAVLASPRFWQALDEDLDT